MKEKETPEYWSQWYIGNFPGLLRKHIPSTDKIGLAMLIALERKLTAIGWQDKG